MDKERLETIEDQLDQARYLIDGVMLVNDPARQALNHLCNALEEMVAEWKAEAILAAQTANRLSCLENGAIPD